MAHEGWLPCKDAIVTATVEHADVLRGDTLYLGRCQHDTPSSLVSLAWAQVHARRKHIEAVVDFGAGDGRFALPGNFDTYLGYEVDARRVVEFESASIQVRAHCAFSHDQQNADLCIGNPPYVRNQDLPSGWRSMAASEIERRTGVRLSGLANAWQYFLMLALWSVRDDGLVVQVVPFEWVYRPAAEQVRAYIVEKGWSVDVYRLPDGTFGDVLTSASITVIDKRTRRSAWRFHAMTADGSTRRLSSASGGKAGVLAYTSVKDKKAPVARRGLSPGTQKALTLTEGERVHAGLKIGSDVVRCVTSLRPLPESVADLNLAAFKEFLQDQGAKCWLIRTDREPSKRLARYLSSVDPSVYQTATCLARADWWRFAMPGTPQALVSQTFKGSRPKAVVNSIHARAVGGVSGIYNLEDSDAGKLIAGIRSANLDGHLVEYASGLQKLEINQLNTLVAQLQTGTGAHG
jgi:hypothetical protein